MAGKTKISAPWETYVKKLKVLFELDPDIVVRDLEDNSGVLELEIDVTDPSKYDALVHLLPATKQFGNVTMIININEMCDNDDPDYADYIAMLFRGNRRVKCINHAKDLAGDPLSFVMFQPEVIQFYNDEMLDYNGYWSGLAQDIAKEVFEEAFDHSVFFCTADVKENKR